MGLGMQAKGWQLDPSAPAMGSEMPIPPQVPAQEASTKTPPAVASQPSVGDQPLRGMQAMAVEAWDHRCTSAQSESPEEEQRRCQPSQPSNGRQTRSSVPSPHARHRQDERDGLES
ncbi:uncharacterized protein BDZ99DRAFT_472150 [Mytilinidion resinicola]|uniref:Uncharacterized protein n=1 Tax=Mytilinidion resinicola TaxID=574789 RepID=A0A6A6Z1T9_9PEZI|nr:uncharacterized protein BDZ99DRAFT_472150 [Mytilinidion resinicola]KAF2814768.1 hypothetical protein BDZ99DRAFT_472150 [Mytilinidion resinicola]